MKKRRENPEQFARVVNEVTSVLKGNYLPKQYLSSYVDEALIISDVAEIERRKDTIGLVTSIPKILYHIVRNMAQRGTMGNSYQDLRGSYRSKESHRRNPGMIFADE